MMLGSDSSFIFDTVFLIIEIVAGIISIIFSIVIGIESNKKRKNYNDYVKDKSLLAIEEFGLEGERYVASMLSTISNSYLINGFTFKNNNDSSTNIDHILVTCAGIFVIETKANKGQVFGNTLIETWQVVTDKITKGMVNPLMQNASHIYHLKKILGPNPPKIYSLIIFPFADISAVKKFKICDCGSAREFIERKTKYGKYSSKQVLEIYNNLRKVQTLYGISIEEHISNINRIRKTN